MRNTLRSEAARSWPDWLSYELPLLACLTLIWILSDQPSLPGPGERGSLIRDIFNYGSHALIYAVVGVLAWRVLVRRAGVLPRWLTVHPRLSAALFSLVWGLLDEWHQSYIPGRTASPWDALTDLLGAALGLAIGPRLIDWWVTRRGSTAVDLPPSPDAV
ncbi:MAG: VanZ family protein [Anaerolineae bacterium]